MNRQDTGSGAAPPAKPAAGKVHGSPDEAATAPPAVSVHRTVEELAERLAFSERRLEALENARRPLIHPILPERGNERLERLLAILQESIRDLADQIRDVQEQVTALAALPFDRSSDLVKAAHSAAADRQPPVDALVRRLLVLEGRVRTLSRLSPESFGRLARWMRRLPGRAIRKVGRETLRAARAVGQLAGGGSASATPESAVAAEPVRHVMSRRSPPVPPLLSVVLPVHGGDGAAALRTALARQTVANREVAVWDVESGRYEVTDAAGKPRAAGVAASAEELRQVLAGEFVVALRPGSEELPASWLEVGAFAAAAEGLAFVQLACERADSRACLHPAVEVAPEPHPSRDLVIVRRELWTLEPFVDARAWRSAARGDGTVIGRSLRHGDVPLAARESAAAGAAVPAGLAARWVGEYLVAGTTPGREVLHAVFDVAEALTAPAEVAPAAGVMVIVAGAQAAAESLVAPVLEGLEARGEKLVVVMLADLSRLSAGARERWERVGGGALTLSAQLPRELHASFLLAIAASHGARRVLIVGPSGLDPEALAPLRDRAPRLRVVGWLAAGEIEAVRLDGAQAWLDGLLVPGEAALEAALRRWPQLAARCWPVRVAPAGADPAQWSSAPARQASASTIAVTNQVAAALDLPS